MSADKRNSILELVKDNFDISSDELNEVKDELENITFDGYGYLNIDGGEYRVISEDDIEDIFYNEVKDLVEDCYLGDTELPGFIANNLDWDAIVEECMIDGYGHQFNSYDGGEIEGNGFYLFRNN